MDPRLAPIAIFEEFLAPAELRWLLDYAAARERDFVQSQVIAAGEEGVADHRHRRSRVLYDVDGFHELLGRRIMAVLPVVWFRLRLAPFQVSALELQLTASNDGEFFRAHTDSDDGPVAARTVTFVYFCHREPAGFTGGALRIYGRDPAGRGFLTDIGHEIWPAQNSIVFFPSEQLHEITPVGCASRAFRDSRMTLNGWLHR